MDELLAREISFHVPTPQYKRFFICSFISKETTWWTGSFENLFAPVMLPAGETEPSNFLLQKMDFKFPLTLSCVHFISSAIGAYLVMKVFKLKPSTVVLSDVLCLLHKH